MIADTIKNLRQQSGLTQSDLAKRLNITRSSVNAWEMGISIPSTQYVVELAELFKVFGDSTRIRILYVLSESEMCVCDLATILGMTQSAISHQLRALKQSKLVKCRRDGKSVFYALSDGHVKTILQQGLEHIEE